MVSLSRLLIKGHRQEEKVEVTGRILYGLSDMDVESVDIRLT